MKLAGKVALVTGASAGIGRATALALAQEGADVAVNYLTYPQAAQALVDEIKDMGRKTRLFPVDVADQSAVEGMVQQTVQELGHLDILVTCAVYSDREPFHTADMTGFRRTIDVTMWGAFYTVRAAAKRMIAQGQGGSVVIVSSGHAQVAFQNCMAYNMAKAALDQMARTAALELARYGIRVNILYPGWTDTPGERKYFSEEVLHTASQSFPAGRLARPEEIARGVLFLVDPASQYVTGSTLRIDGGAHLPWWSKRGEGEF
jgi:glucose 1-dehydrogenase